MLGPSRMPVCPRTPEGFRTAAIVVAALWMVACSSPPESPAAPRFRNAILVSIDTLRADRLGVYGHDRPTSPNLDRLASAGWRFEHAIAEAPWTLPSHATMLSGLHPSTHGVQLPSNVIGADVSLLAERLQSAGFQTIGVTDGGYVGETFGFARGFDRWSQERQPFATSVKIAGHLVSRAKEPFFLFLHTYQVHCPYEPAARYAKMFATEGAEEVDGGGKCDQVDYDRLAASPARIRFVRDAYDAGIRQADEELAGLIAALEAAGRMDDTVVVVTSDHGEELGEHGRIGHAGSLHGHLLRVPLLVYGRGLTPRTVARSVGLSDVAPTILELLGQPPIEGADGRSLVPLALGQEAPDFPDARISLLRRDHELASVMDRPYHLVMDEKAGTRRLFDLSKDPLAQVELSRSKPETVERLRRALETHRQSVTPRTPGSTRTLDEGLRQRLRELGYAH